MKELVQNILSSFFNKAKNAYWGNIFKKYRAKYDLDKSFKFNGQGILFYGNGEIKCGKNSYIGWHSSLGSVEGTKIQIGDNCRISHNVRIYSSTNIVDQDFNSLEGKINKKKGDVIIGDGVWIGVNVIINPNVSIGDNAVIAANTVVTKDVPEKALVGSAPQKIIKYKTF